MAYQLKNNNLDTLVETFPTDRIIPDDIKTKLSLNLSDYGFLGDSSNKYITPQINTWSDNSWFLPHKIEEYQCEYAPIILTQKHSTVFPICDGSYAPIGKHSFSGNCISTGGYTICKKSDGLYYANSITWGDCPNKLAGSDNKYLLIVDIQAAGGSGGYGYDHTWNTVCGGAGGGSGAFARVLVNLNEISANRCFLYTTYSDYDGESGVYVATPSNTGWYVVCKRGLSGDDAKNTSGTTSLGGSAGPHYIEERYTGGSRNRAYPSSYYKICSGFSLLDAYKGKAGGNSYPLDDGDNDTSKWGGYSSNYSDIALHLTDVLTYPKFTRYQGALEDISNTTGISGGGVGAPSILANGLGASNGWNAGIDGVATNWGAGGMGEAGWNGKDDDSHTRGYGGGWKFILHY